MYFIYLLELKLEIIHIIYRRPSVPGIYRHRHFACITYRIFNLTSKTTVHVYVRVMNVYGIYFGLSTPL